MKTSIAIAMFSVVGAGAAGAAALVSPYQGSDTLFDITTQAISAAGLTPTNAYVGGGSGNGLAAMVGATPFAASAALQQTAPMSRMIKNESTDCSFNGGTLGSGDTHASGIVIGLDAVDIFSSTLGGSSTACNGTADNTGTGLTFSGTTGVFAGSNANQNWKWILALVYGGKDLSPGGITDCNQTARRTLVANWSSLFQNSCTNASAACAATGPTGGALWHAFRRDDTSGTSDVFASILGLSPSTSSSSSNGFGASPYCNALNWDTSSSNANCANGTHKQWTGPGGIFDPVAADGVHRRPPPGTWGDNPDPTQGALGADVLPTQFQDNDPIRRSCLGSSTNNKNRAGEEVCNIDGALGLVVPMVDSDFVPTLAAPGNNQYPTNACNTFVVGKSVNVFTCAIRGTGTKHSGECPNGDALIAGGCLVPIDSVDGTSQCVATKATVAALQSRALGNPEGRHYNVQLRDGTVTEPGVGYVQYKIPALGTSVDFAAAYNRIHQVETAVGNTSLASGCQMVDMTDQIACLAQADPCSIGYAGDGGKGFATSTSDHNGVTGETVGAIDAIRVAQIYPQTATVQLLGTAGEYQLSRKLYFNSLVGFGNVGATNGDPQAQDELTLAKFEATPADINPILVANDEFELGSQSPAGANTPFCEDFNEQTLCGAAANANGCTGNPAGIPTISTVCGDGVRGPYEECDNGTANGAGSGVGACSLTCRCVNDFVAGNCD